MRNSDQIDTVWLKSLSFFTAFVFCTLAWVSTDFLFVIAFFLVSAFVCVCVCCVCLRRTAVLIDVIFSIPHSTSQPNEKKRRQKLNHVLSFECRCVYFYFSCFAFANSKSANSKLKLTVRSYIDICAVVKFQRFFFRLMFCCFFI